MKKAIKVNLGGNLQGLSNKNGNYRSIYKGNDFPNLKDIILALEYIHSKHVFRIPRLLQSIFSHGSPNRRRLTLSHRSQKSFYRKSNQIFYS